jgi:predicted NBD/HSP70 family sugar kinase
MTKKKSGYYAGLDVGLRSTFICVVDDTGKQLHA